MYWSPKLKIAFSVIPMSAVAQAMMKIVSPTKICTGRKKERRCEASPGQRKVTRPRTHWAVARMMVRRPHQEWRL